MEHKKYVKNSIWFLIIGMIIGYFIGKSMVLNNSLPAGMSSDQTYLMCILITGYSFLAIYSAISMTKYIIAEWPLSGYGCLFTIFVLPAIIILYIGLSFAINYMIALPKFIYHIVKMLRS